MKPNKFIASILLIAFFMQFLLLLPQRAQAQIGDPIQITFGQPNIWSLEQAHYLLSQMRERSLRIKANELRDLDPNSAEASRINLIRQMFGLNGEFTQRPDFGGGKPTVSASPTPVPSPAAIPSPAVAPSPLDGTIISKLIDQDFLEKLNSDSKLNATTQLDNHVQLQYEIIAKQLTLLRDEVGPDERLVFLELPQTIYASASETKGKVVQTYWEIAGYSEYDKNADLSKSIEKVKVYRGTLESAYLKAKGNYDETLKRLPDYQKHVESLAQAREAAEKACAEKKEACAEKDDFDKQQKDFEKFKNIAENKETARQLDLLKVDYDAKKDAFDKITDDVRELERQQADINYNDALTKARETLDRIKQQGAVPNNEIVERVMEKKNFASSAFNKKDKEGLSEFVTNRRMRTVDIIPRQSSLNVNDIQETVKSTVLGGAFSFLFGLGLRTNFQRQRDTFQQYLHQDIYASGFGKGENIFGWTFGPVPGTKRIAPGIRTTYAVVVVPRTAEALVVNARGCYFSRKNFQPQKVMDSKNDAFNDERWRDDDDRECFNREQYIIPVPNAGDARGFWVTGVDYTPVEKTQKVVVSIKGKNFTSQVGVMVNGIPLQQVVELTRKLPSKDLEMREFCENEICGKYEVIDAEEITLVFRMPKDFEGTPEISVVGPGRAVNLRELKIKITAHGTGFENKKDFCLNCKINEKKIPFMFGSRTAEKLNVTDLQVFPDGANTIALLSGTKFSGKEDIYVNGIKVGATSTGSNPPGGGADGAILTGTGKRTRKGSKTRTAEANKAVKANMQANSPSSKEFISAKQYKISFDLKNRDSVTVLVRQCLKKEANETLTEINCEPNALPESNLITTVVKTFQVNTSTQFIITKATALRYDKANNEMFVRIEGTGLDNVKLFKINDKLLTDLPPGSTAIPVSTRELLVKIFLPSSTVKLTLKNSSEVEISSVVVRPPDIDATDEP